MARTDHVDLTGIPGFETPRGSLLQARPANLIE